MSVATSKKKTPLVEISINTVRDIVYLLMPQKLNLGIDLLNEIMVDSSP